MFDPVVHIVDDEPQLRRSIEMLLQSEGLDVRGYSSAEAFLRDYAGSNPGCLVLDIHLTEMSGLELQRELKLRGLLLPVVMISANGAVPNVVEAMRGGAVDFLEKPFDDDILLARIHEAIRRDMEGDHAPYAVRQRIRSLSPRELEVMEAMLDGQNTKSIANQLGVSVQTVDKHRGRIFEKMQIDSLLRLYRVLDRSGHDM